MIKGGSGGNSVAPVMLAVTVIGTVAAVGAVYGSIDGASTASASEEPV